MHREAMPDASRKILGDVRLQKHVLFRLPQKRKVGYDRPFRAVVRLQRAFHLQERRLPVAQREAGRLAAAGLMLLMCHTIKLKSACLV